MISSLLVVECLPLLLLLLPIGVQGRADNSTTLQSAFRSQGAPPRHGKQLRIYNGEDASGTEFPFMALVLANTQFDQIEGVLAQNMCGGSILSERVILTAAHCVVRDVSLTGQEPQDQLYHPRNLNVWVGDLEDPDAEQFLFVKGVIVHEKYDSYTVTNDIALLVLEPEIAFTSDIATISLPDPGDFSTLYQDGAAITVIGWGTTEDGETSGKLQKLRYEITAAEDCYRSYGDQIHEGMLCTGTSPMEKHSSTGDSGGPLFTKHEGKWTQLGLVSWGAEMQTSTTYDVNTRVGYYNSWIQEKMAKALTDYVTSTTPATDSTQMLEQVNLGRFLYQSIAIATKDSSKFTEISIESGYFARGGFLMIYDGSSVVHDTMLAQLNGELQQLTFTASTGSGLTVAVVTGSEGEEDFFSLTYRQVKGRGNGDKTPVCADGYAACSDRFYCIEEELFCEDTGIGQCGDASDEQVEVCESLAEGSAAKSSAMADRSFTVHAIGILSMGFGLLFL